MLIGGSLVESVSARWMDSVNPATEEIIGRIPDGVAADVERAVEAGRAAQPAWAGLSVRDRSGHLLRLADAIEERADEMLALEVADTGNTITGMSGDIKSCLERLRYYAGLGYELQGRTIPETNGKLQFTLREPFGVVGRIVAFNHPAAMAIHGVASPLVAGNSVVLKPSEQCSLSAALLAEIGSKVLPPGVLNVVTGGLEVGEALVRHRHVKRLSFVGSVKTGLAIQRAAAETAVKSLSLELGGKNPFIVFPDVDIERVAKEAVIGMNFVWQGQSCSSTSRLFVHESIYDAVVELVAQEAAKIRPGDPSNWSTQMGAMNSSGQLARTESYVKLGIEEGARLVTGGKRPSGAGFGKGFWFEPTVFADVRQDMRIAREEIFGPVLSILRWSNEDDVIEAANRLDVGLTGAIWSNDISTALRAARRLESGYIWINGVNVNARGVPFGGYKNSGIGRERGLEELYSYTEEKSVQLFL
ncbi:MULTISPECIES: aldehyde dehydrogenase family protein [unclassified Mesorhizobium]|uniref:aldehyde dehydrogenase family protein n=1 Tax=unclassified Mesorhizobium TaxID=325217 RepID=UPI002479910A|nr:MULTISPECIES: aldehyde dehydrogenase family protein [unclassified Mesorhizobium]